MNDEPALLQRISEGDPQALHACIDRYGALVWSLARRRIPDVHDQEEAVQDVFAALWENAERFDATRGSERSFVTTLARRRIIDRARRRRTGDAPLVEEPPISTPAMTELEIEDDLKRVRAALARLRPVERRVLHLSIHEGLTHREVSETEKLPVGTVKTHLRRGLQRVRALLATERPESD